MKHKTLLTACTITLSLVVIAEVKFHATNVKSIENVTGVTHAEFRTATNEIWTTMKEFPKLVATTGDVVTATNLPTEASVNLLTAVVRYSTLSIKRELSALNKWESAKALMYQSGVWDDYILANYLVSNDPVFVATKSVFVQSGIVTQAELDALLTRCIWTAD